VVHERTTDFDDETALTTDRPAQGSNRNQLHLHWTDSAGAQQFLVTESLMMGAASGGLLVRDPTVSRMHAELEVRDDGVWIRDLQSKNGTYVNNIRVIHARVADAAVIRLGSVELTARYHRASVAVALWPSDRLGALLGGSVAMRELFARIVRVAATESSVLVRGETGTGKELVAKAIHEHSSRKSGPFVTVDCGAMPPDLLEAELFGHVRGAFTGATSTREGAFESAEGGTVFLDEIGELPLQLQPKLLRVLDSRTIRRVGESQYRAVNVRIVSATHRDLASMVSAGAFREDLYFRLAVLPLRVAALRERLEDVPLLAASFVSPAIRQQILTPTVLATLSSLPWLGNVRELRNTIERIVALGADEGLGMVDGPLRDTPALAPVTRAIQPTSVLPRAPSVLPPAAVIDPSRPFKAVRDEWMDQLEREYVTALLKLHHRNISAAASAAGLDRSYLHRLIKRHNL
jgi:transcriptional regulator with GAF, ATPase, and Fis domain